MKLDLAAIERSLATKRVGRKIVVHDRVASTSDLAAAAGESSRMNDGLVILAEEQTDGRGSRGRSWHAPRSSSILMSVLLFPDPSFDDPFLLTAVATVAICKTIEQSCERIIPIIKWPNDVLIGGKKVAGVLVERKEGVVLGIGLNVNQDLIDLPSPPDGRSASTSLFLSQAREFDRSQLVRTLIVELDALVDTVSRHRGALLTRAWWSRFELAGERVRLRTHSGEHLGVLTALDDDARFHLSAGSVDDLVIPSGSVLALDRIAGSLIVEMI